MNYETTGGGCVGTPPPHVGEVDRPIQCPAAGTWYFSRLLILRILAGFLAFGLLAVDPAHRFA